MTAELAFVTSNLGYGGAERHVELVVRGLRLRGIESVVVCVEEGGPRAVALLRDGFEIHEVHAGDRWWLHPGAVLSDITRQLRSQGARIVMTNGYSAEVVGRIAARRLMLPVLQWKHNIGHTGHFGARDRITEWLLRPLDARVLAVSQTQVSYLTGYLGISPSRIRVIRNVVEPHANSVESPGRSPDEPPTAISVAGFRPEKDHASLLRAFARVLEVLPTARLKLAGDGPERESAERLAASLGLSLSVSFLGNRGDVPALLREADLFVLASYAVENLSFAVLEAMDASLPVVACDVGAMRELVEDGVTGSLVPKRDTQALASAMIGILSLPDRGVGMGAAAKSKAARDFPYEGFVDALHKEVANALGDSGLGGPAGTGCEAGT